jgi:hypothetical protein
MIEINVPRVLGMIGPGDKVLDIGGCDRPFNRADFVMDMQPFERLERYMRGQGPGPARFSRDTWIQRDICDKNPYPFGDKELDFVVCSHVLEDVRDPLWVCSEMVRIAKRGYLEVPSRVAESTYGREPGQVGWTHHRWLIDIEPDAGRVRFMQKYHMIHSHWRFSVPVRYLRRLPEEKQVQWLFWDGAFAFEEVIYVTLGEISADLEGFVQRTRPYPTWMLAFDRRWREAQGLGRRTLGWLRRRLRRHPSTGSGE